MIPFVCSRFHRPDHTPIISNLAIQQYAEAVLADYSPDLLVTPGKVRPDHLIEHYLGIPLLYLDLYYPKGSPPIAGATVFADTLVPVFDRDSLSIRQVPVPADSILIDNATLTRYGEGFCRFTHLHEVGHYLMHRSVFHANAANPLLQDSCTVLCRNNTIGRRHTLKSQQDFRESQANTFAAALAMPRPTFVPFVREKIAVAGHRDGIWLMGSRLDWDRDPALDNLLEELSRLFGVSRRAAGIQMRRQGLLTDRYTLL